MERKRISRCAICGKTFECVVRPGKVPSYCSSECARRAAAESRLKWKREARDANPILAQCPACGETFRKRGHEKYCPDCRVNYKHGRITKGQPLRTGDCTDGDVREVMRVAFTVPETERWKITRTWPKRKLDLLRSIYRAQHEL